jgi:predicted RNA-binding Zn ribbon-like protein
MRYRQAVDDDDFPVLGTEPVAVEFANTAYGTGADRFDFLGTAELIEQWCALVPGVGAGTDLARRPDQVRELRDAIRDVLSAVADDSTPEESALAVVNSAAEGAPTVVRLRWREMRRVELASGRAAVLGRLANSCAETVTDPSDVVCRCEGPGCTLLFVRCHRRRRFCHPSCAHRDRQARYYRRHTSGGRS